MPPVPLSQTTLLPALPVSLLVDEYRRKKSLCFLLSLGQQVAVMPLEKQKTKAYYFDVGPSTKQILRSCLLFRKLFIANAQLLAL